MHFLFQFMSVGPSTLHISSLKTLCKHVNTNNWPLGCVQYICSKNHVFSKVLSICPFLLQSKWACQLWCQIHFLQIEKNGALECLYVYEGTMIQRGLQACLQKPLWMSRWRKHQQPRTEIRTKKNILHALCPFIIILQLFTSPDL